MADTLSGPSSTPRRSLSWSFSATCACMLMIVQVLSETHALAQGGIGIGGLDPNARESLQNATVNDSPEARKDIETAHSMERLRDWNRAASWYQEVMDKYPGKVIAWKANKQNVIDRYRGIRYEVKESLANWPNEGIIAYRAQYEAVAAGLLDGAAPDDRATLSKVYWTYFITDAGKQAGLRLIDLHMEAGEFAAAAAIGDDLLQWYPASQLVTERPRLLFRTAVAYHLNGDDKLAAQRAEELKQKYADAAGAVYGKDVVLTTALDGVLATARPAAQGARADSWPMLGGSPSRSEVSAAKGLPGAKIYGIELSRRGARNLPKEQRPAFEQAEGSGLTLGICPSVDGGQLFFQDGARVYAMDLESGNPLPGWVATYGGGERRGAYQWRAPLDPRGQQHTITVTETSVVAVMGAPRRLQMYDATGAEVPAPASDQGTRLVCLERDTGRDRWKPIALATIKDERLGDDERERLRALELSGSPLVVGDRIFVMARGSKDPQFENCYVLCFDLASGQYRWSSLIATSNSNINIYMAQQAQGEDAAMMPNATAHLAAAGGRVFVLSNLGALAALDAYSGAIAWLAIYPRSGQNMDNAQVNWAMRRGIYAGINTTSAKPWEYNPVVVHEGRVFAMPTDGTSFHVYDAATGAEFKRIATEDLGLVGSAGDGESPDRPTTFVGVMGDLAVVVGKQRILCFNWKTYDPAKTLRENLLSGTGRTGGWYATPETAGRNSGSSSDVVRGRPFLTTDAVFLPTRSALFRLSLEREGAIDGAGTYPRDGHEWDATEGPGNVVVTSEHVIIAGARYLNVYTDMRMARLKLDREVAAAPNDPAPRLRYAEVMFAAGQLDVSLTKMKEAIELLGGTAAMLPGEARQRVFNDCLTFAQRLAKDRTAKGNDAALGFYELAAAAADAPSERVNYRLNRARFATENLQPDSYATAVALYQQILATPELRSVPVAADDGSGNTAGVVLAATVAETKIGEVVKKDAMAYAAVGEQAKAALALAREANDPARLLEVARTYPNAADVASAAMLEAAETFERGGSARQATHVLRQIYRKYDTPEKAKVVEAMVRNYLTLPNGYDVAQLRLQQGARRFGDARLSRPLVLPDGKTVQDLTLAEAAEALKAAHPSASGAARLADLRVPPYRYVADDDRNDNWTPRAFLEGGDDHDPIAVPDVSVLLVLPAELRQFARPDRVVAVGNGALQVYLPGRAAPLAVSTELKDAPRGAAWISNAQLLAWSAKELALLEDDGAKAAWHVTLTALPTVQVVTAAGVLDPNAVTENEGGDAAAAEAQVQATTLRRRGGIVRINGRFVRVGGNVVVQAAGQNDPNAAASNDELPAGAAAGDELIAQVRPLGDRIVFATTTGRLVCLDRKDGKALWQTRLSNHPLDRVLASEDFTVVRVTEDSVVQLLALDNYDGQIEMRINFNAAGGNAPINLALSPDGVLVYTLPDRMRGRDLYESSASSKKEWEYPAGGTAADANSGGNQNGPMFVGCGRPGQLVIRGRQVLAIEQSGRFVSVHSIEDGTLLQHTDSSGGKDRQINTVLQTGFQLPQGGGNVEVGVVIRICEPYMYLVGPRSVQAYHIDSPAQAAWSGAYGLRSSPNLRDAVATTDYLVAIGEPGIKDVANANPPMPACRLFLFSRAKLKENPEKEGGRMDYVTTLTDPTGVTAWQAVDGGIYYLTGDRKLKMLRGAK